MSPSRRRRLLLALPTLAFALACASQALYPGDLVIGVFDFHAQQEPGRTDCDLDGGDFTRLTDGGFDFAGTLSRDSVDGGAWFTLDGYSRLATYEAAAQRYVTTHRAPAPLASCGESCEGAQLEETMTVVVLSDSQDRALGSQCANLPDGGLPDGSLPGPTLNGYDAERACGELNVTFIPGTSGNCTCVRSCTTVYGVEGKRRVNGG